MVPSTGGSKETLSHGFKAKLLGRRRLVSAQNRCRCVETRRQALTGLRITLVLPWIFLRRNFFSLFPLLPCISYLRVLVEMRNSSEMVTWLRSGQIEQKSLAVTGYDLVPLPVH